MVGLRETRSCGQRGVLAEEDVVWCAPVFDVLSWFVAVLADWRFQSPASGPHRLDVLPVHFLLCLPEVLEQLLC